MTPGSLRGRVEKLFEVFGSRHIFGGVTAEQLAIFCNPRDRAKRQLAPPNVRRLAAVMGIQCLWRQLRNPDGREGALAKRGLTDPVTPDDARSRMVEIGALSWNAVTRKSRFWSRG